MSSSGRYLDIYGIYTEYPSHLIPRALGLAKPLDRPRPVPPLPLDEAPPLVGGGSRDSRPLAFENFFGVGLEMVVGGGFSTKEVSVVLGKEGSVSLYSPRSSPTGHGYISRDHEKSDVHECCLAVHVASSLRRPGPTCVYRLLVSAYRPGWQLTPPAVVAYLSAPRSVLPCERTRRWGPGVENSQPRLDGAQQPSPKT